MVASMRAGLILLMIALSSAFGRFGWMSRPGPGGQVSDATSPARETDASAAEPTSDAPTVPAATAPDPAKKAGRLERVGEGEDLGRDVWEPDMAPPVMRRVRFAPPCHPDTNSVIPQMASGR